MDFLSALIFLSLYVFKKCLAFEASRDARGDDRFILFFLFFRDLRAMILMTDQTERITWHAYVAAKQRVANECSEKRKTENEYQRELKRLQKAIARAVFLLRFLPFCKTQQIDV
jgi:hypothetical protein